MSLKPMIVAEMTAIARDNGKAMPPITDDLELLETEFDSLCFALLVARMEDRTGIDPFMHTAVADLPVTVGDLVALYDTVAASAEAA